MKTECFVNYTFEDFLLDKDFRALVQNADEAENLKNLIESLPEKRYEINLAIEVIRGLRVTKFQQSSKRKDELWLKVIAKPKKRFQLAFVKYAAAVLVLIGAGSLFYFFYNNGSQSDFAVDTNALNKTKVVNKDDALLILSNGEIVNISSKESTVDYSNDGSNVKVNDSKTIGQTIPAGGVNKMIVPYGKRSTLTLSDGTKVWLNSGSTLIFPPAFSGNLREVQLIGEGFFDVTHNKLKPFYVNTDAFNIKVYGTRFNIQSYRQDNASSIILVEGSVSMKSNDRANDKEVFLTPNQRATLVDGANKIEIGEIDNADEYISWIEGYLSFSDENISHLLKQVSRYYNVDIDITNVKNVDNVYGKLDLKDNLEKVLDGIAFISNTKYRKIGDKYEFYQ